MNMMAQSGLPKFIGHGVNMLEYTVNFNGKPVRKFADKLEAHKFMVQFVEIQRDYEKQFQYIDEAVNKSDLKESLGILKNIMERK